MICLKMVMLRKRCTRDARNMFDIPNIKLIITAKINRRVPHIKLSGLKY